MDINATLVAQMIVFLVLIWVTMKFIWPPLKGAMEERARRIEEGLSAADKARKELAAADKHAEEEVRKARAEASAIIDRAQQQAGQIVDKARQDAVLEAGRQKAVAQTEIDNMSRRARDELRGQVAGLAVKGAEKILQREIDPAAHKAMLDQLVAEI
ncbi:MAG TPA: F0F1 ATP synthase subunit B [Rhodanobacteraceae bacterium]|nr:F0F1 ATP synthase subunit B [Rhodanobacteraceae bacterium]